MKEELRQAIADLTSLLQAADPRLRSSSQAVEEAQVLVISLTQTIETLERALRASSSSAHPYGQGAPYRQAVHTARLPTNVPTFKRPTAAQPYSPEKFIGQFERVLKAGAYPEASFTLALAASCEADEAEWVDANLVTTGLPWAEATENFLRHFVDDDLKTLYKNDLEAIQRKTREPVLPFVDRYTAAMRFASENPDLDDASRVAHLLKRLPLSIRDRLLVIKLANPATSTSVSKIARLIVGLHPDDNLEHPVAGASSTKWGTYHESSTHNSSDCQRPQATIANPPSAHREPNTLYCTTHGACNHTTLQCRSPSRNPQQQAANTGSVPFVQPPRISIKCHQCGQLGHIAALCRMQQQTSHHSEHQVARLVQPSFRLTHLSKLPHWPTIRPCSVPCLRLSTPVQSGKNRRHYSPP